MVIYNDVPDIVHMVMNDSRLKLFMAGSRYFGNFTVDSDWDFYHESLSTDQQEVLQNYGFYLENFKRNQLFGGVHRVYRYHTTDIDIHILECPDIRLSLDIQQIIRNFFPEGYSDKKHNATGIWKMAEMIVRLRREYNDKSICL